MLFRPTLHLKPAPTDPSPRVSLITADTVSGCLPPLLSLPLCPHQHPHSRDPVKGSTLTCENHPSMLILWQQHFSGKLNSKDFRMWKQLLSPNSHAVFVFLCMSLRNEWGPPDRKVDTRKYRAEPRSIFDYEPGKSSILEQERAVCIQWLLKFNTVC